MLLIFGVLAVVYWFGFKDKTPPAATSPEPTPESIIVTKYEPKDVQKVSWNFGNTKATLERVNDTTWKLSEPPILVDNSRAEQIVSNVAYITGQYKYPFTEVSREDAGLAQPSLVVSMSTKDNKNERILVGKKTIDGEYYYITKDGLDYSTLANSYMLDELMVDPYTLTPTPSGSPTSTP